MVAEACEDVVQVGEGVDPESLAGCDQAGRDRGGRSHPLVAAIERPVAATDSDAPQAALGTGMPTSGLCRVISPPMGSQRESAALIVTEAA
jgi:hypothetical protein